MLVGRPTLISSGRYELEVIDVYQESPYAHEHIIAISMLIKKLPLSKIIGDIPDTKCTLMGMDLRINN